MSLFDQIKPGSKVTILVPNGLGRNGVEYKRKSGKAVFLGSHGWVLNLGGRFGTPGIASPENIVAVK